MIAIWKGIHFFNQIHMLTNGKGCNTINEDISKCNYSTIRGALLYRFVIGKETYNNNINNNSPSFILGLQSLVDG